MVFRAGGEVIKRKIGNFKKRLSTLQTQNGTNRRAKERRKRELGMDTKNKKTQMRVRRTMSVETCSVFSPKVQSYNSGRTSSIRAKKATRSPKKIEGGKGKPSEKNVSRKLDVRTYVRKRELVAVGNPVDGFRPAKASSASLPSPYPSQKKQQGNHKKK